ncbi:hypothetical protein SLEP1_g58426 [Rubroshorea leprosula]|uniref:Uncharacterized protein n=1 Tax=Rubroshorea leprosula TaxID=152421 RepID=A0AAV5MTC0_9ROSI|nr:hypothetical protein SLEP1_g58426 [Rubroshorea leprosula]
MKCLKFLTILFLILPFAAGTTEVMKDEKVCVQPYGIKNCTEKTCSEFCGNKGAVVSRCSSSISCTCLILC